jgi:hypothetical protein
VPAVRAPIAGVHLELIGVRALPATFTYPYTAAIGGPRVSVDALYLGLANGFIVAYRPQGGEGLRLPAATTTVTIKAEPDCPGVH